MGRSFEAQAAPPYKLNLDLSTPTFRYHNCNNWRRGHSENRFVDKRKNSMHIKFVPLVAQLLCNDFAEEKKTLWKKVKRIDCIASLYMYTA